MICSIGSRRSFAELSIGCSRTRSVSIDGRDDHDVDVLPMVDRRVPAVGPLKEHGHVDALECRVVLESCLRAV
jgi:hypothetical protein